MHLFLIEKNLWRHDMNSGEFFLFGLFNIIVRFHITKITMWYYYVWSKSISNLRKYQSGSYKQTIFVITLSNEIEVSDFVR